MASTQVDRRKSSFKALPDFSFPPKYTHSLTILEIITPTSALNSPPKLGFSSCSTIPIAKIPSPGPTHLPEIMTPITPLSPSLAGPTLLTIPFEIRLQIYNYVLLSYPIHHTHLSPLMNDYFKKEEFHTSMLNPQGLSFPCPPAYQLLITTFPSLSPPSHPTSPLESSRIRDNQPPHIPGKIPAGLLTACRQLYAETHALPFTTSHFGFVNWFRSGVYAARQFSRSLRPWQSSALRYVSVEVLGRDLWVGGMASLGGGIIGGTTYGEKGLGEWRELCGLWEGVWGLRLGVKGSIVLGRDVGHVSWNGQAGKWTDLAQSEIDQEKRTIEERGILNVQLEWVMDGLLRMNSLRWIELEIEDEDVDREVKLAFCAELERVLSELRNREDGWMDDVKVVFVERVPEKEEKFYVGEPGDEDVWSADI